MTDFDLTSYLANGEDDEQRDIEQATAEEEPDYGAAQAPAEPETDEAIQSEPSASEPGAAPDFDLTSYLSGGETPRAQAQDDDYGVMERQRDSIIAETGEDMGAGEALARNLIPFVGDEAKTERYNQLQNLQSLYDNTALKDIQSRREKGERGDDKAGSRKKRDTMMDAINNSSFMGTSGFGAALQQVQHARAQEKKTDEETYLDQLESVAKNAGLDKKAVKGLRDSSATVEEFAEKLRGAAEGELKAHATRRKEAQARLEANKPGALAEAVNGLITNTGYTGKYIIASAAPVLGLAGIAAQSAEQRATELQTKDYDVDDDGSLVVLHTDDTPGVAAVKGIAYGVTNVAVEQFFEKGLGLAYKGIKKIPGVGKVVGAVGDTLAKSASKITGAIGAKFAKSAFGKSAAGKWLIAAAENFGKYQRYTGVNNLGWEMAEEHVQNFADTVLGFGKKSREYTTLGNEARDWWHNQFLNYETNREIFMGLVGTMALQGAYAGTKAHHDIQKWRNNKGGFLKTVLDDKTVDALSDTEIEHLYNFVNSKRFTKENVDRLLARVNDRVEYANAILGLKEANTPFFDTNKGAIDEAVASGAIKSKFVPPTVEVNPDAGLGRTIDWRPYTWKDGTRTQRVFDPETGIAIDKLGGNRLCVTNRDGARIVVDGETAGDSFARALSVADKMSISNQLLDAKRPAKEAYIKKRIAETAQGDNFILVKNGAEFEKRFPELAADNDYNPNNPAVTLRNGKVVLVTDNIRDAQEVNRMILHEAAIHSGLKKALTPAQKRKFLHSISDPALDAYKRRVDERREARGLPKVDWDSDEYAEEAFAHVWDSRRTSPMLSQKVDHFVRETGRKLHLPVSYNENDLEVMVDTLQRDANKPGGSVTESAFDTTDSSESVPYNEARRDYSGEVADTHKPVERTADETALRNMARNDRIAAAHPNLWEYALRETDGDEGAAAEYVSGWLEEEARNGKKGEMERAHHALRIAEKIENGEDLKSDDMDILEENGFSGQILYTDYGYRRQKDGTWKKLAENREETLARLDQKDAARREVLEQKKAKAATKEEASETRTVAHEEQAEPEPRVQERSEEAKAAPTKATEVAAPKKPRVLSGAALARKESAAKERKLLDRFIDNDAPRGVMAFIREEGRLMAKPERVRVRDAHGNISWRYQDRVAGDALDNFFDGMNASESKFWSNALFGEGASSKDYATGRHGDNAQDDLREWFGRNDYTVDEALAQLRKEYDEYRAFKERGGLTREEAETEKRYQEELAREIEIDGTVYDKDALAENETAHEIYNSALVEVLRNSGEAETMFSRNELRKLKPGDTLRVGNSEEVFAVDSYDDAKGELVVSEAGIAGNPLFTDEEVYRYTNRRFRVTENGWSEEPKPPFKKEGQHEEAKTEPEPRKGTDEAEPRDETRERGGQENAAKPESAPETAEVKKTPVSKKPVSRKPVTASVEFGGYNARRYSKPWIAKVTAWDAGKQPVIEFGNYVGDDGGTAEISARAGDVVRYGQKDYRGRGTTKQYGIVQADGSVQDVSDKEAMEAFRANAKAEEKAQAEEKSAAPKEKATTATPEKKEASAAEQERLFVRIENFAVNSRSALENFIKAFDKIAAVRPLAKDSHGALQMSVAQRIAHSIASSTYATPAEKIRFGILAEGRGETEMPAEKPKDTGKTETPAEKPKGLGGVDLGGMGDAFGDLGNQIRWFARDMEAEQGEGDGDRARRDAEARSEYDAVVASYTNPDGTKKPGWMRAPNGKPTNLTERQWVQVRTPSFKRWFGDWENDPVHASKVVDENGEPKVVYHGTRSGGFTAFDDDYNQVREDGVKDRGFFFTDELSIAATYSNTTEIQRAKENEDGELGYEIDPVRRDANDRIGGEFVYPQTYACFLNIRNPKIVDAKSNAWDNLPMGEKNPNYVSIYDLDDDTQERIAKEWAQDTGVEPHYDEDGLWDNYDECFEGIVNWWRNFSGEHDDDGNLISPGEDPLFDKRTGERVDNPEWKDSTRNLANRELGNGNDGILFKDVVDPGNAFWTRTLGPRASDIFVALNPAQIKSATDSTGAFDPDDPDIRWFARDMEERSEEELQAHNLAIVIKMIKIFAEKGGKTFEQFARTFAAYCPEPYRHIKNTLPGFWLNASIAGVKIDDIDKQGALAALAAVDADLASREADDAKATPAAPAEAPAEPPKHATRGEAISAAADEIAALIGKGEKFTRQTLENIVGRHLGGSVAEGSFEMKEATDILELAVNRYMKDKGSLFSPAVYVGADAAQTPIRRIEHILSLIPTQTTRSAEQDKMQQFSTPPHEAFLAAWTANVSKKDISLEPSAGIGGIAVFSKIAGADVILNELSPRRREILGQLGLAPKVYDFNAENLWSLFYPLVGKGEVKRPTVVVMNPPFSNAQRTNRKDTIGVGGKHIEEALDMLAPGGRLVAIVGHGMAHDAESPKVRAWWRKINAKYQVRADVTVDGKNYAKYGTTYDNNLIVIDKVAPDKTKTPVYGIIHDIGEGPQLLWSIRNDRPAIDNTKVESNAGRAGSAKTSAENGRDAASGQALGAGTGNRAGGSGRSGQHMPERRSDDLGSGRLGDNRDKPVDGSVRHPEGDDAGNRRTDNGGAAELLGEFGRDSVGNGVQPIPGTGVRAGTSDLGINYADTDKPLQEKREVGNGTFSEYKPTWVSIPGAKPHPTPLVESTAMASVLPPKPTYKPILPESAIKKGQPSDAQIEQIIYAGQAHEKLLPSGERKGYFIGDGTGVGKGTEISGIIYDNFAHGRKKAVWVSNNPDLLLDAKRDLEMFGLGDRIFDFVNAKKAAPKDGIAFLSYDGLSRGVDFDSNGNVTDGAVRTNYRRLADWLGAPSGYDGLIVFDESHKAGNATAQRGKRGTKKASLRGKVVVALQKKFPKARILYVSATGATEVSNLAYATRLGLWGKDTAFGSREQFIEKVSAGGLSVMEIVARDMKSMGDYMARTLSYEGIVNRKLEHRLSPDQIRRYDEFADAWRMVSENIKSALVSSDAIKGMNSATNVMSAFWGAQQRFFNAVLTSMQMPSIIADAKKQLASGNSVVFQLVNTNEASQKKAIEKAKAAGEEINAEEMDLSPRDILIDFVERSFPTVKYVEHLDYSGKPEWGPLVDANGEPVQDPAALEAKENLLTKLRMMKLDNGALETIVEEFGAENVAEITGRTRRREMVRNENGEMEVKFVRRSPKMRNVEIDEFNEGKRRVLVFSDAGGTGKSFHADRRFKNQQKRIHYLVQAGWRADGALQGFGRTHRSNEATAPEYVLCTTDIKGHKRFISSVARRLAQLGSLTAGDRSSAGSGIFSEEDNLENQYAKSAIKQLFFNLFYEDFGRFNDIAKQLGFVKLRVNRRTGEVYEENMLLDKYKQLDTSKLPDIQTFLNRILSCRVETQNSLFGEFEETMHDLIETAKDAGKYDPGLEKLPGDSIKETDRTKLWSAGDGTGSTDLVEIEVGKRVNKMPFDQAQRVVKARANGRTHYFARNVNSGKVFGFAETSKTKTDERGVIHTQYRVFSPDGTNSPAYDSDIRFTGKRANFERLGDVRAEEEWNKAFAALPDMTTTKRYFAHGTLLPIWDRLGVNSPRIFRIVPTGQTGGFLGMEIAQDSVNAVLRRFGKTPASIELTPDAILNRIMQEGKAVALQNGWELRRARVNGAYRVELKGPESAEELVELQNAGLGFAERIGYVPRFFIPRTKEDVEAFLAKYPAIPDDGGLSEATDAADNEKTRIMNMTSAERVNMLREYFGTFETSYRLEKRRTNLPNELSTSFISDRMKAIVSAMQSQEIFSLLEAYQSRDSHAPDNTVHMLRTILKEELDARHELKEADFGKYALWYSRDLDPDDFSAIAIRDVNLWRKARILPEIKKPEKTSVKKIIKEGKYLASNTDEMDRFIKVSLDTPTGWTAAETNAVQQRRIELENDYDEKTYLINQAEMNGNKEEAQKIREARNQVQDMIDTLDRANRFAAREWGLTGLARRFLLNRDGTFARFAGEIRSDIGRPLTEEEERGARMLWDAYRAAQGKLDEETIRKTGELLKDVLRKKLKREEAEHKMGHGKGLKEIEKEYSAAIDHLVVHANRSGGYLFNLPNGRRWIDAIRRYHMAAALETGHTPSVDEMVDLIAADVHSAGLVADTHDIMQIITGHGNTYEADNSELEKALREQRALMNEYQKWEDMMDEGHLPDKTGLIRDEPTQQLREAQKKTREMMREFMEKHPELAAQDATKRLKTIQDSLMKRWQNEIADLQKAIDSGVQISKGKNHVVYTPEMEAKRRELEEKRREYNDMFPAQPLTHAQKLDRYLRALNRQLAMLEEKREALKNAKTDAERAAILGKKKGEQFTQDEVGALRDKIADVKDDIQDLHDLYFPAGTYEEFRALVDRRRRALMKNIERIQAKLNARDFGPQKHEPSELAKRVANAPEVVEATRLRNAAAKRLMQERERYKRSVLPYNAGRAIDWMESLMAAPRVFRTMLDLSATLTQGAALFESHPVLGYSALVNSIKSFASEKNTDTIMAALMADPDYGEFIEMGGHIYNVSNLDERGVPEEFRGITQKLVTIKGKKYALEDIPGVKASERSFGMFLNCMNVSVYKAIKAYNGWGPTGPSVSQKKDIALALNVATGRGYENKGGHGTWDRIMSFLWWAPRYAFSGFKMATGANILAPHWTGDITERSYKDRMVSSKQAAKEWGRQIASMAAWTLLVTLLMGRKDPEWLEEVLNPLSSHFLNVRRGNTELNFFGPIKQWWTFMARFITGKTVGVDGVERERDRAYTAGRFVRGKLSPLASLAVDLVGGEDFLGDKLVWNRSAEEGEKNAWKHIGESVGLPLSISDLYEVFKENSLANALMLTPFMLAGAGKSTYQLDEYSRKAAPFKSLLKQYRQAQKEGRFEDAKVLRAENPILGYAGAVNNYIKRVESTKKQIRDMEKRGVKPSENIMKRFDIERQQAIEVIEKYGEAR